MPLHVTYINTGLFTPAAHAYGLRPLRAPQARASQLNSSALSSPRLKPCRSLSYLGRGQLQLPSVVHLYVAISSWYYTYNKREKEICAYIYTHICLCARHLLDHGPNELRGHSSIPALLITPLGHTLATLLPLSCPVNLTRSQRFQHI